MLYAFKRSIFYVLKDQNIYEKYIYFILLVICILYYFTKVPK